jgi:NADH-quinone oxidoreductase subunit M
MVSFAQTDMKKLVAYSSVSHLGFVVLGIFALNDLGISGGVLQMVNHGLTASALFLIVGIIYERRHTREMAAFGGLWKVMPIYGSLSLVAVLASVGLPGLNGFISEYTVMQGVWLSQTLGPGYSIAAVIGVIIGAVYLLRMFSRVFMGDVTNPENAALYDIRINGISQLALALAPCILLGLYPNLMFGTMNSAVNRIAEALNVVVASLP